MPLMCRLRFHHYVRTRKEDGSVYLVCDRCGRESYPDAAVEPGTDLPL